jgi:CheY-like chemotaxis protein
MAFRYAFPKARLLIVDDIATNLAVAEGLLAPYLAIVDTCAGGAQAIEMVKRHDYDIVFMDHMMPEMDGIEATAAIRALEGERFNSLPIVALTANAVSGMREMFLENGFSDFLAKPIDISSMEEILARWIPKEKRELKNEESWNSNSPLLIPNSSFFSIPGVDTQHGIAMTGGTTEGYRKVVAMFRKDAQERLSFLQKTPDADGMAAFATHVHALKSASASIGAAKISAEAARLEDAGIDGDLAFIRENLPGFAARLAELAKNIGSVLEEDKSSAGNQPSESPAFVLAELAPLLGELKEALKSKNTPKIDRLLEDISQKQLDAQTREIIEQISDQVLMAELDSAADTIQVVLDTVQ